MAKKARSISKIICKVEQPAWSLYNFYESILAFNLSFAIKLLCTQRVREIKFLKIECYDE